MKQVSSSYLDLVADESADVELLDERIDRANLQEKLFDLVRQLPKVERNVIAYMYGFLDGESHTIAEASEALNMGYDAARMAHTRGIKRLQTMREKLLKEEADDGN